ncbi:MAG: lipid-A-disaccharide synthase [Bacteroidetes bacterium]|nr:lipid-A-disaccharide synthase [Bacteroidota bacterium]
MKYYIIAGEASGDLHGSNLIRELRLLDPDARVRCWGGDLMRAQGAELVKHYKDLAFMGFLEVVKHLPTILGNLKTCKKDMLAFKPDLVILIDYPGFNLRVAEFAHNEGFKVCYYISPQVWAWKKSRVYTIRRLVDKMFVILPFEKEFYEKYNYTVDFVGHPLLDVIERPVEKMISPTVVTNEKPVIALLPGSRKQEIQRVLPVMLEVIPLFPDYHFMVAGAPGLEASFYKSVIGNSEVDILFGKTYELLGKAAAALVTSGTASLETALFQVPQLICYKGSAVSYAIARRIVKVSYIGLPNLVMDRPIIKELIQDQLTTENLATELRAILEDPARQKQIQKDYNQLWDRLGGKGASRRTAKKILALIKPSTQPAS